MSLPIKNISGFVFFTGFKGIEFICFDSKELLKYKEYFIQQRLENIMLSRAYNFNSTSINFLSELNVKRLFIYTDTIKDIGTITALNKLLYLRIMDEPIKGEIDFSALTDLETFEGFYTKNLKNIFTSKSLKVLCLWQYKSSTGDLSELAGLENLEELHIIQSNIKSCKGLEGLKKIKKIGLAYNKNLDTFMVGKPAFQLEEIEIELCKKFDFTTLGGVDKLKTLNIINNGKILSLEPIIGNLPSLEKLQFTEGDLAESNNLYLLQHPTLKHVWLSDKRHYFLKTKEINEALKNPEKKNAILMQIR
jgi:Leucine-rich repeat (LRR) protein